MARIATARVIAIIRAATAAQAVERCSACIEGGLDVAEISLVTPGAFDAIAALVEDHPSAAIGAGTVLDATSCRLAALAGARFVVAPTTKDAVIRCAHRYGLAVIPGAATPTEVVAALECGADAVKIFPARLWSPAILMDFLAALPQAPVVPTGGVTVDSAEAWLAAGAIAVGIGGDLTAAPPDTIAERAGQLSAAVIKGGGVAA